MSYKQAVREIIDAVVVKDFSLPYRICAETDVMRAMLKSNVLLELAKEKRCDPKKLFFKVKDELNQRGLLVEEEKGFLYITPQKLTLPENVTHKEIACKTFCFLPPRDELVRQRSLLCLDFFIYLRACFDFETELFLLTEEGAFKKYVFESDHTLGALDSVCYEINWKQLQIPDVDVVFCANSEERDVRTCMHNRDGYVQLYPKVWEEHSLSVREINEIKDVSKRYPLQAAMYVSGIFPSEHLDCFVIEGREQGNAHYFLTLMRDLTKSVGVECLTSYREVDIADIQHKELFLRVCSTAEALNEARGYGKIPEFIVALSGLLEVFQMYFNSPDVRVRILEKRLSLDEKEIISAVYAFLDICHSKICQAKL